MSDYISREDVKKLLWERISLATFMRRGIPNAMKSLSLISEELEKIPAADVRPVKRGKWIPVTNGRGGHECDQCHNYAPSYQTGEERLSDFCPCCGADMTGGADG